LNAAVSRRNGDTTVCCSVIISGRYAGDGSLIGGQPSLLWRNILYPEQVVTKLGS
jgi:hypothetical protein